MKRSKILALVLAVLLVMGTFAACGNGDQPASSQSPASTASKPADASEPASDGSSTASEPTADNTDNTGDAPKMGGEFNVNAGMEPTSLNSITTTYSIEFSIYRHLMENLYVLDDEDLPQPGAAETVDISDDSTVFTFHLRDDGKWTNGDPVTANDFSFAWQQVLNPDNAADYAYFLYFIKNAEAFYKGECSWEDVGVKVIDDSTLEVTLDHAIPYAQFLFAFGTLSPINEKFYNEVGADAYCTEAEYFCTNGAFKLTEWKHDSLIVTEKNPDFHGADEVYLDKINWKIITEAQAGLTEFFAGGLDMVGLSTGELIKQAETQGFETAQYADGSAFYIYFNHSNEYLKNQNLRKALALGFDKEMMVNSVYQNGNQPMTSFTCPAVLGSDGKTSFAESLNAWNGGELTPKNGDVEAAKGYLETALSELGCTVEDLSSLSIDCGDSSVAQAEAAFYQEQWRTNLGIDVQINPMPTKQGSENRKNGNYTMSLTGWGPDYNDPMTFLDLWVSTSGNNQTFYASEAYDKLIADASVETDFEKRQEMFYEVEKLIVEDLPVAPSYWRFPTYAVGKNVGGGVHRSTFQDIDLVHAYMK